MENNENKNSTAVREDNIEVFSSHGNVVKQEKKPKYDYKMIIGIVATIVFIYSLTEDCIRFAYMGTDSGELGSERVGRFNFWLYNLLDI